MAKRLKRCVRRGPPRVRSEMPGDGLDAGLSDLAGVYLDVSWWCPSAPAGIPSLGYHQLFLLGEHGIRWWAFFAFPSGRVALRRAPLRKRVITKHSASCQVSLMRRLSPDVTQWQQSPAGCPFCGHKGKQQLQETKEVDILTLKWHHVDGRMVPLLGHCRTGRSILEH